MSLTDLFPGPGHYRISWHADRRDDAVPVVMREHAHLCARCGALAADKKQHYRWHQAVDTGATTILPTPKDPR